MSFLFLFFKDLFLKFSKLFLFSFFIFLFLLSSFLFLTSFSRIKEVRLIVSPALEKSTSFKRKEKKIAEVLNSLEGELLWRQDLKKIAGRIQKIYPAVNLRVKRQFPSSFLVFLEKRQTLALLLKKGSQFYSLSFEGEIGERKKRGDSLDYPVLVGSSFLENKALRKDTLSLLSSLPEKGAGFSLSNISDVRYKSLKKSLIFQLLSQDISLELRVKALTPKKLKNINFVLAWLKRKQMSSLRLDVRQEKKIIVKKSD